MEQIAIHVEVEINPTEDLEKVEKAVVHIFESRSAKIKPTYNGSKLHAEFEGLEALVKFRNLLSLDRIRAAARKVFLGGLRDSKVRFFLNKQAAFAGHVSFSEKNAESSLGPIKVTIECKDPKPLIDWLAPRKA